MSGLAAPPVRRNPGDTLLVLFAVLAFGYLFVPIGYVLAFSFNDGGRSNLIWRGFTLDNWARPLRRARRVRGAGQQHPDRPHRHGARHGDGHAARATRWSGTGSGPRGAINILIFLPMATPEVVLGASLLAQFLNAAASGSGFWTIVARAHDVHHQLRRGDGQGARRDAWTRGWRRPRPTSTPRALETFWRVTLPLLLPGIAAAALLSFSLSFDDFIITNFNSGNTDTFPKFVYVAAARGIPAAGLRHRLGDVRPVAARGPRRPGPRGPPRRRA